MSSLLRSYAPRALSRAFETKLGIRLSGSRHRSGWYTLDGRKLFRVIMPKAHSNWSKSVQRSLLKVTELSPDEFDDLVRCPMTGPQFADRARELFPAG